MNNPLSRYHFTDDNGHPLENCVEYRELLAEVERLRGEVARLDKEADWLAKAAENGGCLSGEVCPRCPNGHHERKRCYGRDMRKAAHDAVMKGMKICQN